MDMRLLGPIQAYAHGRPIQLGPRKQRFVLAVLALEVNQVVSVDRLVELMWPQSPPRTAVHAVRVCASRLRSVLADAELVGTGGGYILRADPLAIDAHRFRALAEQARIAGHDEQRIEILDRALALWVGPALVDSAPAEQRDRLCRGLEESRLIAIEDRLAARLRLGQHRDVLDELTSLVAAHPTRERLIGQLMLALYRAGRPADALRTYREARRHLADELGLDPGPELQRMELAILRGDPGWPPEGPTAGMNGGTTDPTTTAVGTTADLEAQRAGRTPAAVPAQLPPAVAGFTGRQAQLATLDAILDGQDAPAVAIAVISGTAGVGKTALAVHWAHRAADHFPQGQLYLNLRGFDDGPPVAPGEAVRIFLDALAVHPSRVPANPQAQVDLYRSMLAGRRMLLVLDNAATVEQVRPLLPGAPGCLVVVTSRNDLAGLLAVEGARALTLDVMTRDEGRQLLVRRIGQSRVQSEPAAVDGLIDVSARLPLALAIIAAQAAIRPTFALAALVADIRGRSQTLDPFDVGDPATDIRKLFSWSYRTLGAEAARLFRLLGLHPGPDISLSAMASLAGRAVEPTARLAKELTRAHLLSEHLPGRYGCHDLLRAYAIELVHRVDPDEQRRAARRRMLDHYLHAAAAAAARLDLCRDAFRLTEPAPRVILPRPANHAEALSWLTTEYRVLLAAIHHAAATGFDTHAWQLAGTLAEYFERRGHWQDWAEVQHAAHACAQRSDDPYALALSHRCLGRVAEWLGRHDEARCHFASALEIFKALDDEPGQARTYHSLGRVAELQGRPAEALHFTRCGLDLFRSAGDRPGLGKALNGVGWYYSLLGDYGEALAYCTEALAILQELGDRRVEANTWDSLGYAHHHLGDHEQAIACYRQALGTFRDMGDRFHEADVCVHLGDTYEATGDLTSARQTWRHALDILDGLGHADCVPVRARLARTAQKAP